MPSHPSKQNTTIQPRSIRGFTQLWGVVSFCVCVCVCLITWKEKVAEEACPRSHQWALKRVLALEIRRSESCILNPGLPLTVVWLCLLVSHNLPFFYIMTGSIHRSNETLYMQTLYKFQLLLETESPLGRGEIIWMKTFSSTEKKKFSLWTFRMILIKYPR